MGRISGHRPPPCMSIAVYPEIRHLVYVGIGAVTTQTLGGYFELQYEYIQPVKAIAEANTFTNEVGRFSMSLQICALAPHGLSGTLVLTN